MSGTVNLLDDGCVMRHSFVYGKDENSRIECPKQDPERTHPEVVASPATLESVG
ncbi:hypothetical protein BYT27DRAFT_7185784 [Phlegmacium glaucopus]|nr:hypothetical protein BYT27DRAFT_7185784 [Phlegmacium glaucopus]